MRQSEAEDVYALFSQFTEDFLIRGNSILTSDKGILNDKSIANCFSCYVEDFRKGGDSYDEKVIEQFKNADKNTKLVFAHAEWLWAYSVTDKTQWRKREFTKRTTGISDESLT